MASRDRYPILWKKLGKTIWLGIGKMEKCSKRANISRLFYVSWRAHKSFEFGFYNNMYVSTKLLQWMSHSHSSIVIHISRCFVHSTIDRVITRDREPSIWLSSCWERTTNTQVISSWGWVDGGIDLWSLMIGWIEGNTWANLNMKWHGESVPRSGYKSESYIRFLFDRYSVVNN